MNHGDLKQLLMMVNRNVKYYGYQLWSGGIKVSIYESTTQGFPVVSAN